MSVCACTHMRTHMYYTHTHIVCVYVYKKPSNEITQMWNLITTCQEVGERECATLVVYKRIKTSFLYWYRKNLEK